MATYPCENCGAPIEVRPRELAIICRECGYEQRLSGIDPSAEPPPQEQRPLPPAPAREPLEPIPKSPAGLRIDDDGYRLRIKRRWFSFIYLPLLFFCIAWDSFLVFWYSMAFGDANAPWLMFVFPICHVAVGVGLSYFVLAGLLNTTTISVDSQEIRIRHRPIPWRGNATYSAKQIRQLYVKHDGTEVNGSKCCALYAMLHDRQEVKLVSGLLDKKQAQAIELAVERHLGIEPEPVKGEVS